MSKRVLTFLWHDERGSLLVTDWVLVAMVLTLGAVAGLIAARDAVSDHADTTNAVHSSR
jgi:hypothetical protein